MRTSWEARLQEWVQAGIIDPATAERVRAFEASRAAGQKLRWPILLALSFGGLLVGAGVLLFVAAHWDTLSPSTRFALVLLLVAVFHIGGALVGDRFTILATVLHAVGTATLGAGIFLSAQIFNLQEHWPGGLMLWSAGAWAGWIVRRDWAQAAFAAMLTPAWLAGEWITATEGLSGGEQVLGLGLLLLSVTYFTARAAGPSAPVRKALVWIGGIAMLPCTVFAIESPRAWNYQPWPKVSGSLWLLGWSAALIAPLLVAVWLRGRAATLNVLAALWAWTLVIVAGTRTHTALMHDLAHDLGVYLLCAIGSIGMVAWGLYERRRERVNLGVAGFALTVLFFYFSDVMDKMGRATSMIGLGLLFLLGGWLLERTRRRLVARLSGGET